MSGWNAMPEELTDVVRGMAAIGPTRTGRSQMAGSTDQLSSGQERTMATRCSAPPPTPNTRKRGPEAGLPSAYAGCGHRLYGNTDHCGAPQCYNYVIECPEHNSVGKTSGGDDA